MSLNMNDDDDENQRLLDQLLPRMIPRSIYCKSIKPLPITRLVYVNFVLVFSYYKIEKDKKFKLIEYPNFVAIINSLSFVGFFDDVI